MKFMKKTVLLLLCGAFMLFAFSCGKPEAEGEKAPDWRSLLTEYDAWATEYVDFLEDYANDPTDSELLERLDKWPSELEEWRKKTDLMFKQLSGFKSEQAEYVTELSRITKKMTDAVSGKVSEEEVNAFISEYDAWADDYVEFFTKHKDDQKSEEFQNGLTNLITESAEWSQKVQNMSMRITDSSMLADFNSEIARITAKMASVYN